MRRFLRMRLRPFTAAVLLVAAAGPLWVTLAATTQHSCHCGLAESCRCELKPAAKGGGGHGHCAMDRCAMGKTHVPSDNALFAALDVRGWFAMPEAGGCGAGVVPAGRVVEASRPLPRSLFPLPETPPPRSFRSVV